jgi:hypothetical protein
VASTKIREGKSALLGGVPSLTTTTVPPLPLEEVVSHLRREVLQLLNELIAQPPSALHATTLRAL